MLKHTKHLMEVFHDNGSSDGGAYPDTQHEMSVEQCRLQLTRLMSMKVFSPHPISKATASYFTDDQDDDAKFSMFEVIQMFSDKKEKHRKLYLKYDQTPVSSSNGDNSPSDRSPVSNPIKKLIKINPSYQSFKSQRSQANSKVEYFEFELMVLDVEVQGHGNDFIVIMLRSVTNMITQQ